jgi:alanine dehydrogenase
VHPELIDALRARGARALACERVEGPGGIRPISRPMGEVAGRMAVQVGARYLERPNGGRGLLLGGIPGVHPARVSILGAGVVGWNAMRAAVGLGADVLVLDARSDRLRAVDDAMGGRVKTLEVSPANLEEALMVSDLVVGAVRSEGGPCPKLVSREQLGLMQRGAVVVDVSVDEGGCFETTRPGWHAEACREIDGVLHHAVPNMPGAVARTATPALSHAMLEVGLLVASLGLDEAIERQPSLGRAVVGA